MKKTMTALIGLLLLAPAAQAFEAPITYARTDLRINVQHPVNPKEVPLRFDTDVRSADSAKASPGWYNFATMGTQKAAMMIFDEPAIATVSHGTDYAANDILFVDAYGVIEQILPSLVSADLQDTINSAGPMKAVIYLQGGTCAKLGISPGDQVVYGAFHKRPVIITQSSGQPVPGAKDKPIAQPAPRDQAPAVQPPLEVPDPMSQEQAAPILGQPVSPADHEQLIDQILKQNGQLVPPAPTGPPPSPAPGPGATPTPTKP